MDQSIGGAIGTEAGAAVALAKGAKPKLQEVDARDQAIVGAIVTEAGVSATPATGAKPKLQEVDTRVNGLTLAMAEARETLAAQRERLVGFKGELREAIREAIRSTIKDALKGGLADLVKLGFQDTVSEPVDEVPGVVHRLVEPVAQCDAVLESLVQTQTQREETLEDLVGASRLDFEEMRVDLVLGRGAQGGGGVLRIDKANSGGVGSPDGGKKPAWDAQKIEKSSHGCDLCDGHTRAPSAKRLAKGPGRDVMQGFHDSKEAGQPGVQTTNAMRASRSKWELKHSARCGCRARIKPKGLSKRRVSCSMTCRNTSTWFPSTGHLGVQPRHATRASRIKWGRVSRTFPRPRDKGGTRLGRWGRTC